MLVVGVCLFGLTVSWLLVRFFCALELCWFVAWFACWLVHLLVGQLAYWLVACFVCLLLLGKFV